VRGCVEKLQPKISNKITLFFEFGESAAFPQPHGTSVMHILKNPAFLKMCVYQSLQNWFFKMCA
jgi:hypothetical protein